MDPGSAEAGPTWEEPTSWGAGEGVEAGAGPSCPEGAGHASWAFCDLAFAGCVEQMRVAS